MTPGKVTHSHSLVLPGIHKFRQRICALGSFEYTFLRSNIAGHGRVAVQAFQGGFVYLRAEQRVALDVGVQRTSDHGSESVFSHIISDDLDILARYEAGFLDGLDGAQSFLNIVGVHALDVLEYRIFQPGFHDRLAGMRLSSRRSGKR